MLWRNYCTTLVQNGVSGRCQIITDMGERPVRTLAIIAGRHYFCTNGRERGEVRSLRCAATESSQSATAGNKQQASTRKTVLKQHNRSFDTEQQEQKHNTLYCPAVLNWSSTILHVAPVARFEGSSNPLQPLRASRRRIPTEI